jgi:hypothetical protein
MDVLLNAFCPAHRLRPRNLIFYIKDELGDTGFRGHLHFFVGSFGAEHIAPVILSDSLTTLWNHRLGDCRIEPFDSDRKEKGISYFSKLPYGAECPREVFSPMLQRQMQRNAALSLLKAQSVDGII